MPRRNRKIKRIKSNLSDVTKDARRARKRRARETDEERSERLAVIRERERLKHLEKKASQYAWLRHIRVDEPLKPSVEWQSCSSRRQERQIEIIDKDHGSPPKVNTMEAKDITQKEENSCLTIKKNIMVSAMNMKRKDEAPVPVTSIRVKQIGTLSDNLETRPIKELCSEQDLLNRVKTKMEIEKVWLDSVKWKLNAEPRLGSRIVSTGPSDPLDLIKVPTDLGWESLDGPWRRDNCVMLNRTDPLPRQLEP